MPVPGYTYVLTGLSSVGDCVHETYFCLSLLSTMWHQASLPHSFLTPWAYLLSVRVTLVKLISPKYSFNITSSGSWRTFEDMVLLQL